MNKKLHILFLCGWYPSKVSPTNGDFIQRHAEAISLLHKVSVLHIISDRNAQKNTIEFSTIHNVNTYIGYVKPTKNPFLKLVRFYNIYVVLLKKIGAFDIVHLNLLFPFGLFALHQKIAYKKPFLISEHWTGYLNSQSSKISFLQKTISKLIARKATYILPVSKSLQTQMQYVGLTGNYVPIGNVVNTQLFSPSNQKEKEFTIVHVSNLFDLQKNITGMLKVAKKLEHKIEKFTWKFIGGTSDAFQELITNLQFKSATIQFINHISHEALVAHMQTAHACVSFSNYETFGIVMTEAIASGTFVISTNTGILSEFPEEDFFKIIPIKDEDALFAELIRLHEQPKKLNPAKMHSYVHSKFGNSTIAKEISKIYEQLLI